MLDARVHGPMTVWFDMHHNTRAFTVYRGGLGYRFATGPSLIGGYAHAMTDVGTGALERPEHRPWAQVFLPFRFSDRWSVSQRIRFDLRFRKSVEAGMLGEDWLLFPRWRSQTAVTYWLPARRGGQWFQQAALEVLIHGGRNAEGGMLDQNRVSLMAGYRRGVVTVRFGYLHRLLPSRGSAPAMHEHDLVVWLSYALGEGSTPLRGPQHTPEKGN